MLVRDIHLSVAAHLLIDDAVQIRGRIATRRKGGNRIFLVLQDFTGRIQVTYTKDTWTGQEPAIGERWELRGRIDPTNFTPRGSETPEVTLVADGGIPLSFERAFNGSAEQESSDDGDQSHRLFRQGMLLAKLRDTVRTIYSHSGFVEIEPKLLTLSVPLIGLEPLLVSYVGFGTAALFPSPASQLRELLLATDVQSVFAISRIFTTTYRDEVTSSEALTAMGLHLRPSDSSWSDTLERACIAALSHPWIEAAQILERLESAGWRHLRTSDTTISPPIELYEEPTIREYSSAPVSPSYVMDGSLATVALRQAIVPPGTVVAEQALLPWFGDTSVEVTTVHLERFCALARGMSFREMLSL